MNTYQPYDPYPSNANWWNIPQPSNLPHHEIVRVNGRDGALSLPMAPNSSALCIDLNSPIIWMVMSDGAGFKTATPYDYSPHREESVAQPSNIEDRLTAMESQYKELTEKFAKFEEYIK